MSALALLALALLAYTYVGYPLAVGVLARLFPVRARVEPAGEAPTISVCLPVFNGASFLHTKVASLLAQDYPAARVELLIYCDGCDDDSEARARALAATPEAGGRIQVFATAARRGKPAALNALVALATGDLLMLNDVRQPLSSGALSALASALTDRRVGCSTGNLVLAGGAGSGVYWRYENWIRRQESRFRGVVGMSGSIAMMRRAEYERLPEDVILDDVLIPARLGLRGQRVTFVPQAEAYDAAFEDDAEFRRKVRTLAGNYQLFGLVPAWLSPTRNPIWFETVSHKVMRLCAPWLMIGLAATSAAGAHAGGALMKALVVGQVAFYAAALVGGRAGRLAGVARTFVVLNAAAVLGLFKYLSGRQRVTW